MIFVGPSYIDIYDTGNSGLYKVFTLWQSWSRPGSTCTDPGHLNRPDDLIQPKVLGSFQRRSGDCHSPISDHPSLVTVTSLGPYQLRLSCNLSDPVGSLPLIPDLTVSHPPWPENSVFWFPFGCHCGSTLHPGTDFLLPFSDPWLRSSCSGPSDWVRPYDSGCWSPGLQNEKENSFRSDWKFRFTEPTPRITSTSPRVENLV